MLWGKIIMASIADTSRKLDIVIKNMDRLYLMERKFSNLIPHISTLNMSTAYLETYFKTIGVIENNIGKQYYQQIQNNISDILYNNVKFNCTDRITNILRNFKMINNINNDTYANTFIKTFLYDDVIEHILKNNYWEEMKEVEINKIIELAEEYGLDSYENIDINPDGTITSNHEVITVDEVREVVNNCIDNKMNEWIKIINSKDGILKQVLIKVIITIIIILATPKIEGLRDNYLYNDKNYISKNIKKTVKSMNLNDDFYKEYRFVEADCLNVRSAGSKRSAVVGKLYYGEIVKIVRKNRNWALVEYKSQNEDIVIKGWVFTRYLKGFK